NFCPFRSPSWERLVSRSESIAFSRQLWRSLLDVVEPRVVICMGDLAQRHIGEVLEAHGSRPVGRGELRPTGWGTVNYAKVAYQSPRARTLLIRLPHLSRFRIFGRPGS